MSEVEAFSVFYENVPVVGCLFLYKVQHKMKKKKKTEMENVDWYGKLGY